MIATLKSRLGVPCDQHSRLIKVQMLQVWYRRNITAMSKGVLNIAMVRAVDSFCLPGFQAGPLMSRLEVPTQ